MTAWPSFENPRDTAKKIGTPVKEVALDGKLRIDMAKMVEASKGAGLVFFCNPNNPTATVHGKSAVADMVKQIRAASPDTMILIDEAYHDYVTDPSYQSAIDGAATPNVFVTRTFSKAYGMAGLRRLRHRPRPDDQGASRPTRCPTGSARSRSAAPS